VSNCREIEHKKERQQQQQHPFNDLFSRTTWVSWYQKGKTSLHLNEARDDRVLGWQWHQLAVMSKQSAPRSTQRYPHQHLITEFLQAGCSSCCPTNSTKALMA